MNSQLTDRSSDKGFKFSIDHRGLRGVCFMKLSRKPARITAKLDDRDEHSLERDKNNTGQIVEEKKHSPPTPTAYLTLGVMIVLLVFLMLVKHVPGLLPMLASLFPKPTNTVTNSTTSGTFRDVGDLYTARIYECDVLDYTKKERQMTLILRYHVNALYDMSQVQMKISNLEADPQATSENSTASAIKGPTITIHLPVEKIEVVLDKYAGMTGKIQEDDLPGIEVFGFKGSFDPEEDDLIAQAFLTLFENDITHVAPVPNMSQNLNELEDPSTIYTDAIRVLVDDNFVKNIGTIVNEKRGRLMIGAQKSVASSLVTYYNALGFSSVAVFDADGVSLVSDEEVTR